MRRVLIVILFYCHTASAQSKKSVPAYLDVQPAVFSLSMVMMHDVVNPPAASRFYAYAMMGAYEIVSQNNKTIPSLIDLVKNYKARSDQRIRQQVRSSHSRRVLYS